MARKLSRQRWRPTDRDLQAYVDGELDAKRRAEVRAALRSDSELRAIVRRYQAQRRALRRLFDPVLEDPLPETLEKLLLRPAKRRLH
jgi:anti-sigma factor RsiW